jgi:Protein of unknown function (DUF2971)
MLEDALERVMSPTPTTGTLFHYTSQEGLLGIVKDKTLWLGGIRHLSDATEFGYTVDLVRTKLNQKLKAEQGHRLYGQILGTLDAIKDLPVFVGSLSERADLLSQWRAYTPHGVGFSVGFEYDHLTQMAVTQDCRIIKCVYDQKDHDAIVDNLIERAAAKIEPGNYREVTAEFYRLLYEVAPALKDVSFFEEREWRIVTKIVMPTDPKTKFRAGRSMLIPYHEFKLAAENQKMPIKRVIVGPNPHMQLSISSLSNLLFASENVDSVTWSVAPSRVPYRSW